MCREGLAAREGQAPFLVAFEESIPVMLCGYVQEQSDDGRLITGAFELTRCDKETSMFEEAPLFVLSGPTISGGVRKENGKLTVVKYDRMPFGPNWAWTQVALKEFVFRPADDSIARAERFVFEPPALSPSKVEAILQEYDRVARDGDLDDQEIRIAATLAYKMMAAAIAPSRSTQR